MNPDSAEFESVPAPLREAMVAPYGELTASPELAGVLPDEPQFRMQLLRVLAASPYAADILLRYPVMLAELLGTGRLQRTTTADAYLALLRESLPPDPDEEQLQRHLRLFRHRELVRIIWRDLAGTAGVTETLRDLSNLADASINVALAWAQATLEARYGAPQTEDGAPCGFGVLAMGKLGGHELNFSSDIDLVFVHSSGGETNGSRSISNEEFFRFLAQRLIDLLSRNTAEGFVYRVDARLRPFGSAGPLSVSLGGLEAYLLRHGRDWERYAYIKARVVNRWDEADSLYRDVLRPFIYRRYLDYGVFSSLREMKAMIAAEVEKKEYRANLKLGPGGIREIEFIVQALQLVRGGTVIGLRERQLLIALPQLVQAGCLPAGDAAELETAYRFLRLAENRLQALHDRQTHDIPAEPLDQQRLAFAMGVADWEAFLAALDVQRDRVSHHFRQIVFRGANGAGSSAAPGGDAVPAEPSSALDQVWNEETPLEVQEQLLADAGFSDPAGIAEQLRRLREGSLLPRLDTPGRQRLDMLIPAILMHACRQPKPVRALDGMVLIIEAIGRRSAYFALLNENPLALEKLVSLCGSSEFLSRLVATHPLLLDELLDPLVFEAAPSREELAADLELRLKRVAADDVEGRLGVLQNFQQAATFRVAIVDLAGTLPLMKVSDRLTDIAELVLETALAIAWRELADRHGEPHCTENGQIRPARFAIIAYGKLGGLELGYGSDLDLVFLHDSAGEAEQTDGEQPLDNAMFFARLTRRIISILTMHTASGKLYDVDIRLRPSGQSGLMVSSLAAFDRYQQQDAWTWEHQALLRSRAVAGDPGVKAAFEALRVHALTSYVRREKLATEVAEMRQRMRAELSQGTDERFDVKQDPGGVADIEFIVQYLVLREAHRFPDLVRWSDNIRQLEALAAHGILSPADAELLAETYREYRRHIHHRNLAGRSGLVPHAEVADLPVTVTRLWQSVFYTAAPVKQDEVT
ncbi:MAG: bifunctional [glutamate--ammonia ligase]-adenylyl-L-tyrosine phosphorylase/[glutamate--ammonia-ligase] adenylyltransferase [Gammaproteobacteria bacterium]